MTFKNTPKTDAKIMCAVLEMLRSRGPLLRREIDELIMQALRRIPDYKNAGYLASRKLEGTNAYSWKITKKGIDALDTLGDEELSRRARRGE